MKASINLASVLLEDNLIHTMHIILVKKMQNKYTKDNANIHLHTHLVTV